MNSAPAAPSPLAYPINVARLPTRGMPLRIVADEDQRRELADAHGLLTVERLEAELLVTAWKSRGVRVTGRLRAKISQSCVVTLEPVVSRMDEPITAVFAPEGSRLLRPDMDEGGEILLDAEGPDGPEPFTGNEIDAGALVEEFFALAIDPYPRKAGVALEAGEEAADPDAEEARGPLHDQLRQLKKNG